MKKYLYCNGDSWTSGEEIYSENPQEETNERYYNTWPWFLSQELNIPVCINEGIGGGSNDRIYRKTFDFIKNYIRSGKDPDDLLIVVGWTSPERGEIQILDNENITRFTRITTTGILNGVEKENKELMGDLDNYRDHLLNLYSEEVGIEKQIRFMDNIRFLCDQLKIKYYDFISIGFWPPKLLERATEMKIKLKDFYRMTSFTEEMKNKGWEAYTGKHPTPESHKKWAILLKNFIEE